MEKQKEVKIIGLKINQQLGILQSCHLTFDPENKLIAIKGEVGSGKTTLQKGLSLATKGVDTLKDDKQLYGEIDEEVELLDGDIKICIGCKSDEKGSIDYVIYTKDKEGKVIKNPEIDGKKVTPASYLKSLQTALTWRIDELMSENPTVQKKLLLEIFKSQLAGLGVVFDKKDDKWNDSILGKIEAAEVSRTEAEFLRKQVGGFLNQLSPLGIDPENPDTYPKRVDLGTLEEQKNTLQYKINNVDEVSKGDLDKIKNKADAVINKIKAEDALIIGRNKAKMEEFQIRKDVYSQHLATKGGIEIDVKTLHDSNCLKEGGYDALISTLKSSFNAITPMCEPLEGVVQFNDKGVIKSKPEHFEKDSEVYKLLLDFDIIRADYSSRLKEPKGDTTGLEKELALVVENIGIATDNNKRFKMLESFLNWQQLNNEVVDLRNEYANMLSGINTGVEGLKICIDKDESSKLDIYLKYNGAYDTKYFANPEKEYRKLSSYSGTQKPLICLLLQNFLLSSKPKAMRYLWIDDVPIDNKTKALLERMGKELDVTIIVNITGDFEKSTLKTGELLIEGGQVFFE